MTRKYHYLKANARSERVQAAIFYDTETRQIPVGKNKVGHKLTFGWAAYVSRRGGGGWNKPIWQRFTSPEEFWDFVERMQRPKVKCFMFCHNSNFDIPVLDLFKVAGEAGWILDMAVIDAPPLMLRWKKKGSTLMHLDTLNFYKMSLAEMGKYIGLPKLDMPDVTISSEEGDTYCKRDVEIMVKAMFKWWDFISDNDLGGCASTLAGQAFRTFRHAFMSHDILIDGNEKATAVSRSAYYGGRSECFRLGLIKEKLYQVDVNSMYPAMMFEHDLPCKVLGHKADIDLKRMRSYLERYAVCARCDLDTDEPVYSKREGQKLIFPTGRFTTSLSTPEIIYALDKGHLLKVHEAALYHKAPIFREYVDFFYNHRLKAKAEGRDEDALLYKLLLNTLYGKTAQRGTVWEKDDNIEDLTAKKWTYYNVETGEEVKYRQMGGLVQRQETEAESRQSFPAIAAHVTAYARVHLWKLIDKAGRDNVYYCDTDSLLVNEKGFQLLQDELDENLLGALKVEDTFEDAEIFASKDYRFGLKHRHKGVKKNAVWLKDNAVTQEQWSSLKGLINSGKMSMPTTTKREKTLHRIYTRGRVLPTGAIVPLVFDGDVIVSPSDKAA